MTCPRCLKDNDKVLESRSNREGTQIRRRRLCLECGHRYTSYERIEERPLMVIKKDGKRQAFDLSKVERGIRTSTEKLSISQADIEKILRSIEDKVYKTAGANNVITSKEIGDLALKELYPLSPVAYVRFASVYREFDDLNKFIEEIEHLARS